ncbi:hypothetical protein GCM10018777_55640 [Streptomyces albogriseolus]|uniref:hypothetical protein n=1 Tax=Streptomyces TaxID=1883 RepID=UPI00167A76BA|nr:MULTISPECIES: hypothetical protein [Streptomyces]GHB15248.1 hypothetical protein GCM10010330_80860 [Streptomyces tendae]GHG32628.1 hypothetical protein GCM10018777_55640 [Streptomyces viridodiastaticus]
MGQDTATAAAKALRLLNSVDLRQQPARGPQERRAASTTPGTPLNLGIVDYLARTVAEVADHARQVQPDAGPMPQHLEGIYDWYLEHTGSADEAEALYRDLLIERHRLEHAVRLGETDVVRKEFCPRCGTLGLMWEMRGNRARCTNRRCRTPDGMTSSWTLARLAAQKIQRTEIWRRNAT